MQYDSEPGMPRGRCWGGGVAPLENFVGKNIKGETKGKSPEILLGKFRREKSQRGDQGKIQS